MSPAFLRIAAVLLVAGCAALAVYLFAFRWKPENAVARSQARFLTAVAEADIRTYAEAIHPDYRDAWDLGRDDVIAGLQAVRRQFRSMEIQWLPESVTAEGESATVTGHIGLSGEGNASTRRAVRAVADAREAGPITFGWRRASGKPWDWKLVSVSHPTLDVPAGSLSDWGFGF